MRKWIERIGLGLYIYLFFCPFMPLTAGAVLQPHPNFKENKCPGCCCNSHMIGRANPNLNPNFTPGPTNTPGPATSTPTVTKTATITPTPTTPPIQFAVQCYTGDQTNSRFIDVGFDPDFVWVDFVTSENHPAVYKCRNGMSATESHFFFGQNSTDAFGNTTAISGLTTSGDGPTGSKKGFYVDKNTETNFLSQVYCYLAVKEAPNFFACGTHTGTGADNFNTNYSGHLTFVPDVLFQQARNSSQPTNEAIRTTSMGDPTSVDKACFWNQWGDLSGTCKSNYIQALSPSGQPAGTIQLGSTLNGLSVVYDWFAFKAASGVLYEQATTLTGSLNDSSSNAVTLSCAPDWIGHIESSESNIGSIHCFGNANIAASDGVAPDVANYEFERFNGFGTDVFKNGSDVGDWKLSGSTFTLRNGNGTDGLNCNMSVVSPTYEWYLCNSASFPATTPTPTPTP